MNSPTPDSSVKKLASRILMATDFSACSAYALLHALTWAERCQAEVEVVHVLPTSAGVDVDAAIVTAYYRELEKEARARLEELIFQAKERVASARAHLLTGLPADAICEFAADRHVDLIVTGTHGWTGLDRVLMGSVAERVVRQAPCPVLTVRLAEPDSPPGSQRSEAAREEPHKTGHPTPTHLLVPLDFSDCSLDAFEYAAQVALWFKTRVTLLHAVEPLSYGLDFQLAHPIEDKVFRRKIESRLSELAKVLQQTGLTAEYHVGTKPARDSILDAASEKHCDLIVMGTHGRRGIARLVMGSVTAGVLRHASCPVLTVKSPKRRYGPSPSRQD